MIDDGNSRPRNVARWHARRFTHKPCRLSNCKNAERQYRAPPMRIPSFLTSAAVLAFFTSVTSAQDMAPAPAEDVPPTSESAVATPGIEVPPAETAPQEPAPVVAKPSPSGPPP